MAAQDRTDSCEVLFDCPSCHMQHSAMCTVVLRRQPVVFGGGSAVAETSAPWIGTVTCPTTQTSIECHLMVPVEDGEYVRRLTVTQVREPEPASSTTRATASDTTPAASSETPQPVPPNLGPPAQPDDWISSELAEWRTNSMATSRTYATTMLTSSSAAIAVYFSVLKYLGYESVSHKWGWVTILPPVMFLCAVAAQALALQPTMRYLRTEQYAEFRARRIEQIHVRSMIGTALFVLGLLFSLAIYSVVLA